MMRAMLQHGMSAILSLTLWSAFSLSGCAFDKSDTDPNRKRDLVNREKLVRAYEGLQGVYEGTLVTPIRTEMVRLTLSYTEVEVGKNQDGEIRYQPELRARFSRLTLDLFDIYMTASYIPETADLTLTTDNDGGESVYIRGYVINGHFSAPVKNRDGSYVGQVELDLVSKEVVAPPDGTANDVYDRIKARLVPISGQYSMTVTPYDRRYEAFKVDLLIRIEDKIVEGQRIPALSSYSRREDGFSTAGKHSIAYNGTRRPEELTFEPASTNAGYSAWSSKAIFENGKISGEIYYPTFQGTFIAERSRGNDPTRPTPTPSPTPNPPPKPKKPRR